MSSADDAAAASSSAGAAAASASAAAQNAAIAVSNASVLSTLANGGASTNRIFPTTAAGLGATVNGNYFYVPATSANGAFDVWENNNGAALLITTLPNLTAVVAFNTGSATDAGVLTGAESVPTSRGAGALQTTWNTVAAFIYSALGLIKTVANVSALTALDAAVWGRVKTQGYGAAGDGGAGNYVQLTGAQTPNGGTVIAGANGSYFGLETSNEVTVAQFGAIGLNHTVDETTQIQAALNWAFSSRKKLKAYPHQQFLVSSSLAVNVNATIDFGQARFFPSSAFVTAGGYMVQFLGVMGTQQYNLACQVNGLWLVGPRSTSSNLDGVSFGGSSTNVSNMDMSDWVVDGFRDNLYFGSNCYLLRFFGLVSGNFWRYGEHYECATNAGENISFYGGVRYNGQNANTAVCVYSSSSNPYLDASYHGVSFDYCDSMFLLNAGTFRVYAPHFENGNQNVMGKLVYSSGNAHPALYVFGGEIALGAGGFNRQVYFDITGASVCELRGMTFGPYAPGNQSRLVNNHGTPLSIIHEGFVNSNGNGVPLGAPATNLLYNSDFSQAITSAWTTNLQAGSVIDAGTLYNFIGGNNTSFKFVLNASNAQSISQKLGITPGSKYLISAAIYATTLTSGSASITMTFYASDGVTQIGSVLTVGTVISANQAFNSNGDIVRIPAGAVSAVMALNVTAGAGQVNFSLPGAWKT